MLVIDDADPYDNKRNETMYFYTDNDSQLQQLVGKSSYAVTFPKGQLPPVKGFWSLTMYNPEHFFYPNALKRYALGTKNKSLKYNPDGSLTIYLGTKSPGREKESNWLPAPAGNFSIWLRAYWPDQAILDGTWQPPVGEIVAKAVVQLFPKRRASPWSTQVRETETRSSIMSNPLAVVRALHTTGMARQVGASRRFKLHAQRSRNCQQARVACATGVGVCPVRDQV